MDSPTRTRSLPPDEFAAAMRDHFMALLAVSFTEEQAMRILLAAMAKSDV